MIFAAANKTNKEDGYFIRLRMPLRSNIIVEDNIILNWGCVMKDNLLVMKSKEFAIEIVILCQEIKQAKKEVILTNQLIRSGTSIGANIHEGNYAQGKADFISKFEIALKECYETEYWLELMFSTQYINEETFKCLQQKCWVLRKLLISSIKTTKENNARM
jgi:four helix bundle protein